MQARTAEWEPNNVEDDILCFYPSKVQYFTSKRFSMRCGFIILLSTRSVISYVRQRSPEYNSQALTVAMLFQPNPNRPIVYICWLTVNMCEIKLSTLHSFNLKVEQQRRQLPALGCLHCHVPLHWLWAWWGLATVLLWLKVTFFRWPLTLFRSGFEH